eukprot:6715532-Alexandrium_andersonii.AAC.1
MPPVHCCGIWQRTHLLLHSLGAGWAFERMKLANAEIDAARNASHPSERQARPIQLSRTTSNPALTFTPE